MSEDKVTYPLDEEGDNLNSNGSKKRRKEYTGELGEFSLDVRIVRGGRAGEKVVDASERNKTGKKYRR